ncbi:rare lipoprotein A [Izhakiella capsodis]|uniref:Endolytic peptidoglycan transglycosylase RlpA n=1 Tax=Izhakiella capsodis TaxID=1367852 RepID=A0A1I5B1U9_9GAMM|nr:rare lipoprotein A [Izhakiella capsodis]
MRKGWFLISLATLLLAACSTEQPSRTKAPPLQPIYSGPVKDIPGTEPKYEPINPSTNRDYTVNGKTYRIIRNPGNYSETGLATWYGKEASGNRTATGEIFDPDALTAAHPTLPLPSYVRVTNLANHRQIVVRVNDRGPYTAGRIIDLSEAAANRLNISANSKVRVDFIKVAPDGTLTGPGTIGTRVAKQSFALPPRPDINMGIAAPPTSMHNIAEPASQTPTQFSAASEGKSNAAAPSANSGGLLGAPQPLVAGVLEDSEPTTATTAPASAAVTSPTTTIGQATGVQTWCKSAQWAKRRVSASEC